MTTITASTIVALDLSPAFYTSAEHVAIHSVQSLRWRGTLQ
jgi:hypothetical protein